MKLRSAFAFALSACAAATLVACNNGDDDTNHLDTSGADVAATLATPDDAAKAAAVIAGLIVPGFPVAGGSKAFRTEATTTSACSGGGSVTFTPDETTTFADDGRKVFDHCTASLGSDQFIENGVVNTRCTAFTGSQCDNESIATGEGDTPATLENKSGTEDTIVRLLASGVTTRVNNTTSERGSGTTQVENLVTHKTLTLVSSELTTSTTVNGDGSLSAAANGAFGVSDNSRASANCFSGKVSVSTPTTLQLDNNEHFRSGKLRFATSIATADVTFNSNESVTVSVNGSLGTTFTKAQLAQFCSVN